MIISVYLRGAMEAHQTSNLGVLSSSLSEDVFIVKTQIKGTEENSEKVE